MSYPLTRAALEKIAPFEERVGKLLDDAETDDDVAFWMHVNLMRHDYVRQAFLADTADRNRWSAVRCMPIEDIRGMVSA